MENNKIQEKENKYNELVRKFREFTFSDTELLNPYKIDFPEPTLWSQHNKLNPWELWHGNLNADILFIGQDFSDDRYFKENFQNNWEKERKSPTNKSLTELFSILGYTIGLPGDPMENSPSLHFTNAVLGIKKNGMAGAIKSKWYAATAKQFTKELIDIVNPRNIIVMGKHAYCMICMAYDIKPLNTFNEVINNNGTLKINNRKLFVVAHCSALGKVNRHFQQQKDDWKLIKQHLSNNIITNP